MNNLHGTGVALVTPFTATHEVDYAGWRHLLDFTIAGGVEYLVINGTTGESPTISVDEHAEMIRLSVKHVAGRAPGVVIAMRLEEPTDLLAEGGHVGRFGQIHAQLLGQN